VAVAKIRKNGFWWKTIVTIARFAFFRSAHHATDGNRWEQVNIDGIGDFLNHNIIAMEFFKGNLYAGTWNESEVTQIWRATPGPSIRFPSWER
jgi:hypothetical protein